MIVWWRVMQFAFALSLSANEQLEANDGRFAAMKHRTWKRAAQLAAGQGNCERIARVSRCEK